MKRAIKMIVAGMIIFIYGCSAVSTKRDLDTGCEFEFEGVAKVLKLECDQGWDTDQSTESTGTITAPAIGK